MTYDLRRLRLKGLIHRIPNTHRYTATSYGLKVAFFYTKLYVRLLRPNWPALLSEHDPFPRTLRDALDVVEREIQKRRTCCLKTCFNRHDHLHWRCLVHHNVGNL